MRVLVTGATGFVGRTLCTELSRSGYTVRAALRTQGPAPAAAADCAVIGELGPNTDWSSALEGIDSVIHLAARAHVLHDTPAAAAAYYETNERGTRQLAAAAAQAGVQRFVYLSSVKVNGERTVGRAFTAQDEPRPQDPYGISKWRGEQHLWAIAGQSGMQAVVVRSPLVYGPGVKANFLRLMRWVDKQWPLPLGAVHNQRSLVSVWNLCSLLMRSLEHPEAAGRTWMVADGESLSTPDLIRAIARAMGRRVQLLPIPVPLLRCCALATGRSAEFERLLGSLRVDISQTQDELGWEPPLKVPDGIGRTVEWYLHEGRRDVG